MERPSNTSIYLVPFFIGAKWRSAKWLGAKWRSAKWLGANWRSAKWLGANWLSAKLQFTPMHTFQCLLCPPTQPHARITVFL